MTKAENFNYEGKFEGGKEDWDANVDVAKLNYSFSNYNTEFMKKHIPMERRNEYRAMIERKNTEVKDYAITSAQYWTKKTNQILNLYVAQNLKHVNSKNADKVMEQIRENVKTVQCLLLLN